MMHMYNNRTPQPFTSYGTTQWNNNPRYNKKPSKVVSIPVHFIGSEKNRGDLAMKIQRVARGYLVRKSLKKMMKMKVELEEIEKKVNDEKFVKKEEKERIRIGESIMNLVLRLDSVRVFHCDALRDLRKLTVKKAVFLQDFVDRIHIGGSMDEVEDGEKNFFEVGCEEEFVGGEKIEALVNEENEGGEKIETLVNKKNEGGEKIEALVSEENVCGEKFESLVNEENGVGEKIEDFVNEENGGGEKIEALVNEDCECVGEEVNEEEDQDEEGIKMEEEEKEESVGTSLVEEEIEENGVMMKEDEGRNVIGYEEEEDCDKEEYMDDNRSGWVQDRKMLKRMMEDNEKMMKMMAQLFERNEKQTSLLTSLTQRVEQLERAFTCDKLRKKKNRRKC